MNELMQLRGAEPRKIMQTVIDNKTFAIMSYLTAGKWHAVKVLPSRLGANRFDIEVVTGSPNAKKEEKPRPINIQVNQPVGISLKYGYGKFIFDTTVVALEASPDSEHCGTIALAVPDRIEFVQRRSYFRVEVPEALKVNVTFWHRRHATRAPKDSQSHLETIDNTQVPPEHYWQGKLVDLSAGGAQLVVDAAQKPDFKKGQFIGMRFTPMPYEMPLMFNAKIRNVLPTADDKGICIGLQIVGLEASPEGRGVLQRLCNVVEQYYQINQSSAKQQDMQGSYSVTSRRKTVPPSSPA